MYGGHLTKESRIILRVIPKENILIKGARGETVESKLGRWNIVRLFSKRLNFVLALSGSQNLVELANCGGKDTFRSKTEVTTSVSPCQMGEAS
jgi:hypothetical protein